MKVIQLLLLIGFCSVTSSAQSIRATVTDEASEKPIPDVNVRVMNSNMATITDSNGQFEFKGLPAKARLIITAMGYGNIEVDAVDTLTQVKMHHSNTYLDNKITITAKRFEETSFKVSEAVTVLDKNDLNELSPRSTPEALMGSAGVWVQKTNHGGGSPIVRGLVGNHILLMVDGIRLNNATYRYGPNQYMATIDPGLIERIEVTRGNGSVLYGSDALGGVVQVLSNSPYFQLTGNRVHGNVNIRGMTGGMEKSVRGEVQWSGKRIAILSGVSSRDFGDLTAGGSLGKLIPTGYQEITYDAKALFKVGAEGLLTATWQQHQQNRVPRYDQVTQGGYSLYNFDPQVRQLGYLRWEMPTSSKWMSSIRFTTALNRSSESLLTQKNGSSELKEQKDVVNTYSASAEVHSLITSSWQAQSGIELYSDAVSSTAKVIKLSTGEENSVRGSYADGATSTSMALYSTHTIDIQRFTASAGVRYNYIMLKVNDPIFGNQQISPDALVGTAMLSYRMRKNYHFFITANTGFRAPNVDDVSKFGPVETTVFEIPSAALSPERSTNIEIGVKASSRIFSGSLAAYHTTLYDLIERIPALYNGEDSVENRKVYQKQNVSKSLLRGIEAEGEVRFTNRVSAYGNVTYTIGENISKNEPMRRIPPLFGSVSLRYHHPSGLWTRLDYLAAGEQSRLAPGDLSDARISVRLVNGVMPGWDVVNLSSGYNHRSMSITASLQNIFDEGYRVYSSGVDAYGRCLIISLTGKF